MKYSRITYNVLKILYIICNATLLDVSILCYASMLYDLLQDKKNKYPEIFRFDVPMFQHIERNKLIIKCYTMVFYYALFLSFSML